MALFGLDTLGDEFVTFADGTLKPFDLNLRRWSSKTLKETAALACEQAIDVLATGGDRLVVRTVEDDVGRLEAWSASSGERLWKLDDLRFGSALAVSADDATLAQLSFGDDGPPTPGTRTTSQALELLLRDAATGDIKGRCDLSTFAPLDGARLCFSDDARFLFLTPSVESAGTGTLVIDVSRCAPARQLRGLLLAKELGGGSLGAFVGPTSGSRQVATHFGVFPADALLPR